MYIPFGHVFIGIIFSVAPVMSMVRVGLNNDEILRLCALAVDAARLHVRNQQVFVRCMRTPLRPLQLPTGRRRRVMWVREWVSAGRRWDKGQYDNLRVELERQDPASEYKMNATDSCMKWGISYTF
jgi:hypothetical protein